ncbi:Transmembrane protein 97 [Acipenser ruthenus]|uniref:Transmembrane protein 97 n=1 Tax=Acipenser ruthenus TaxID=7906 RepID=A0A444UC79_ACIRT|nr:Transmembrane protein 97 [Acipenser ruthenus]
MAILIRLLEWVFFLYFASHIPITLAIDLQALLPAQYYSQSLKDLLKWYARLKFLGYYYRGGRTFKSFIFCEALLQTPFFPVAAYAFFKGGCRWIRTPAIVYATHVATSVVPIIAHVLFHDFPKGPHPGPETPAERLTLAAIYAPYLLVPIILLLTMLFSTAYNGELRGAKGQMGKKSR